MIQAITDWAGSPAGQFTLFTAVKVFVAFSIMMTMVAYIVLVERRVCAFMQDRSGRTASGRWACCSRRRRHQGVFQGGIHAGARAQNLFLPGPGHCPDAGHSQPRRHSVRLEAWQSADGAGQPERRHSLHVRHGVAGRLQHRAGGLRGELEISVPRRHPFQRADDFLRDFHGSVRHPACSCWSAA